MRLRIPKYENIKALNYEYLDSTVGQYYRPFVSGPMKKRLVLALKLLGEKKVNRILDVGYGGGTFLLELSQRCNEVYGIDTHPQVDKVKAMLEKENIKAIISQDSILKLPYPEKYFDRVVCMSVLEHITGNDLIKSIAEMKRVLKDDGKCIVGIPTKNPISNFIIANILRFVPDDIHPTGHTAAIEQLKKSFVVEKILRYPFFLPTDFSLYVVCSFTKGK